MSIIQRMYRTAWTWVVRAIGPEEFWLAVGLALLGIGCWKVWEPAAYLAPALVLLWIFLPQRVGFVAPRFERQKKAAD